jgi:spermidine synthase
VTARRLAALVALSLGAAAPALPAPELVHSEHSLYRQVLVYEEAGTRCLCFTRGCRIGRQSCMVLTAPDHLVFDYTQMMMSALFMGPRPQRILIIGLGGGSLPRALAKAVPEAAVDVVDIDPAVVRVARQYFSFVPGPHTEVFEEDGRVFVRHALREGRSYDLILLDAYDHEYIPEHLLTREFLLEVKRLLQPGGVVAANTFSGSRLYDSESVTYRAVFGEFYNLKSANRVIIVRNGALPPLTMVRQGAISWAPELRAFDIDAEAMAGRFGTTIDWDANARVLTDQYSPANLLNGR